MNVDLNVALQNFIAQAQSGAAKIRAAVFMIVLPGVDDFDGLAGGRAQIFARNFLFFPKRMQLCFEKFGMTPHFPLP
jgi:hypothetical protein